MNDLSKTESNKKHIAPEIKKQYNTKYYEANKKAICKKLMEKKECNYCKKMVSHQNMGKHQMTARCKLMQYKEAELKKLDEEDTRQQIKEIKQLISKLSDEFQPAILEKKASKTN
jgi:hypothetical protein